MALALGLLVGCSSSGDTKAPEGVGTLRVPLAATSYVGKSYVLCQGIFSIDGYSSGQNFTIDASQHTTEAFVTQSLPSGDYQVSLTSWQLCEATVDGLTPVDAQLMSSSYQYVYISPLQASYVYFSFMVQGQQLAFDGQLVIQIDVWQGSTTGGTYPGFGGMYPTTGGSMNTGGVGP
jgi:hypothetical protein